MSTLQDTKGRRVPAAHLDLPFGIALLRARSNRMRDLSPLVPSILSALDVVNLGRIRQVGS